MSETIDKTSQDPLRGIAMKVLSIVLFICMQAMIKEGGRDVATGQVTFFRSLFAMVPIMGWLAFKGVLWQSFKTTNPTGHFYRGFVGVISMGLAFYGIIHLPLPESIAIGYAMPLFSVIAGAVMLGEDVRRYRWAAVAAGFVGVLIILWPRLTVLTEGNMTSTQLTGVVAVLASAAFAAVAMVHVRQLVRTDNTTTIVLYFSLSSSVFSLMTLPFGWSYMTPTAAALLVGAGVIGGIAQILLTESYRYADVSAVAPFEYTSIIWGTILGYYIFGELPSGTLLIGAVIVIGSGIFILYRETRNRGRTVTTDPAITP